MTDPSAAFGEVELRRRLGAIASLVTVDDDGWEALQELLANAHPLRRRAPLKPLAVAAAAVLVLGVIVLVGRDRAERVTTVDTTTTTSDDTATPTSTTTADPGSDTTSSADPGDLPAGSAPGGLAPGSLGGPESAAAGGDAGAVAGGTVSASPPEAPAVPGSTSTTSSTAPPASTPPPVPPPGSGADLTVAVDVVRTDVVTFTSTITNRGPDVAPAAWATIEVEGTLLVNVVRSTVGDCTIDDYGRLLFTCPLGDLAAGDAATMTLEAQVLAPTGTWLNATVITGSSAPDPIGPGSSDSVSIPA